MTLPLALEALQESLRISVEALQQRRASEIPEPLIDRFVELDWLEWHGGSLRLTTTGENIHRQEVAQWRANAERANPRKEAQHTGANIGKAKLPV